jgi:hypothetical protein
MPAAIGRESPAIGAAAAGSAFPCPAHTTGATGAAVGHGDVG